MTKMTVIGLFAALALAGCADEDGKDNSTATGGSATPTASVPTDPGAGAAGMGGVVSSAAPALCESDDDCGEAGTCVEQVEGEGGFCDVDETLVVDGEEDSGDSAADPSTDAPISLGTPALCLLDTDCGDNGTCGEGGYCEVDEMQDAR